MRGILQYTYFGMFLYFLGFLKKKIFGQIQLTTAMVNLLADLNSENHVLKKNSHLIFSYPLLNFFPIKYKVDSFFETGLRCTANSN